MKSSESPDVTTCDVPEEDGRSDSDSRNPEPNPNKLDYSIDDVPPWYLCVLLGFQHYLTMFGGMLSIPLIVAELLCVCNDWLATSQIMCTMFLVSGIVTLVQCSVGCRLPIAQGPTVTFVAAAAAIFALDKWKCQPCLPPGIDTDTTTTTTLITTTLFHQVTYNTTEAGIPPQGAASLVTWEDRMREMQGAIIIASLVEVVMGATGLVGVLVLLIGPLTVAPFICLIGLSLFPVAITYCEHNWWIAILTMFLIALFSQYLRRFGIPVYGRKDEKCFKICSIPLFRFIPVILGVCLSWFVCFILTVTNAVPNDPNHWAYKTRTDTKNAVLTEAPWFRAPYPFQWGLPTFSVPSILGMTSAVICGMIESIGDYYACARMAGAPVPANHVINRGMLVEGCGCVLAGMFGTGTGVTSYSENIGAIAVTRVGSRRVMLVGAVLMIIVGFLSKFAAFFITIPEPVIGGMFVVMFGLITAVGISNLQYVDMNSSRNLFVFGVPMLLGLALPTWLQNNPNAINTGVDIIDQTLQILGQSSMVVGGGTAAILDNTVPGTPTERGLLSWSANNGENSSTTKTTTTTPATDELSSSPPTSTYDLPFCMPILRRWTWTKYFPICPQFEGFGFLRCCRRRSDDDDDDDRRRCGCGCCCWRRTMDVEKDPEKSTTPSDWTSSELRTSSVEGSETTLSTTTDNVAEDCVSVQL